MPPPPAKRRADASRLFRLPETLKRPRGGKRFEQGGHFHQAAQTLRMLTLSALLALPAATALAQWTPNQYETMRQHGLDCNLRYDGCGGGGSSYQGTTVIHIPKQIWINYYAALAGNGRGNVGIAEFARSEREAKREALRKCGAKDCKIDAYTRNGCLAGAWDDKAQRGAVGAEGTKEEAEAEAVRICQSTGLNCVINYSKCFHAVRVR